MCEGLDSTKPLRAKAQRTPGGAVLGAAIFLPADVISRFVTDGTAEIEYNLKPVPEGILIEIGA